ncbi:hypothetical protein BC827DRAFT_1202406 [Russula dissimulans]|nr:hypothetical protein BC827DRAFT_1202406 [Russula dissimulans]
MRRRTMVMTIAATFCLYVSVRESCVHFYLFLFCFLLSSLMGRGVASSHRQYSEFVAGTASLGRAGMPFLPERALSLDNAKHKRDTSLANAPTCRRTKGK